MNQSKVRELFEYRAGGLYWRSCRGSNAKAGDRAGRLLRTGYRSVHISGKRYQEHRLVYLYHHAFCPPMIDHINRDKADNHIENLREASYSQNQVNTKDRTNARGVREKRGKWEARVWKDGKTIRLGLYEAKNDAVSACIDKRKELFGKFAQ